MVLFLLEYIPAAVSSAAEIHRIHKLPALATKLNQISENGKEGFARRVSRYLRGEGEKNEWGKVDLVCKEGNPRNVKSIDRADSRNGAYTKGRARVYADICSASAQGHGHTKATAPNRRSDSGLASVKINLKASAPEMPEDKQSKTGIIYCEP